LQPFAQPGGNAWYGAQVAARLGANVRVITRMAPDDVPSLTGELVALGVEVEVLSSSATTTFVNEYWSGNPDGRRQRLQSRATAFESSDVPGDAAAYVFGPLTPVDMEVDCLAAAPKDALTAVDIQGLIRSSDIGPVTHVRNPALADYVRLSTIVKASTEEALSASRATSVLEALDWFRNKGAREVLLTMGRDGSLVATRDGVYDIPAYRVSDEIDSTGCGDTYLAAYVVKRVEGLCPEEAGHFASAVAGLVACAQGVPPITAGKATKLVSGARATDIGPRLRRSHPGSNPEHSS